MGANQMQNPLRQPPHSIEAEMSVLGGLMMNNGMMDLVSGKLTANDFYQESHQIIFSAIKSMIAKGVGCDFVTMSEHLRDEKKLERVGGLSYLGTLVNDTPSTHNIEAWADLVAERAMRRRVITYALDLAGSAYQDPADRLISEATKGIDTIMGNTVAKSQRFIETLDAAEKSIQHAKMLRTKGGLIGVSSSIKGIDNRTGGFHGPRLIGVAARPGSGKTAWLNQMAVRSASQGVPGLICSIEMGADELAIRSMASASGRNFTRISHGYDEDVDAACAAAAALGDIPLFVDTETNKLSGIMAQIAAHKHRHGIKWAAIDHIGLIQTERFSSRNDQLGHISGTLKQFAKRINIPIIVLCQLSRGSEKENRKPGLHDLRDSGNIEQDLDIGIFLHVNPSDRDLPVKPVQFGLLKNRGGRTGWLSLEHEPMEFDGATQVMRPAPMPVVREHDYSKTQPTEGYRSPYSD